MIEEDFFEGVSGRFVQAVFSVVCLLGLESSSRFSLQIVGEIFSHPDSQPEVIALMSEKLALDHLECALRVLKLESQAFLTEEQLQELQVAQGDLQENWQQVLRHLKGHVLSPPSPLLMRRIDAIFLSQIEWLKDVKYLECGIETQIKIISESPIADLLGG